jgi:Fe-S-cluster-containing dehydrogenase component
MSRLTVTDADRCVGCQLCMFACNRRFGEGGLAKSAIRVRSAGGFERGFIVVACRACPDPPCMKVCPVEALEQRRHGGVVLKASKCIGCHRCAEACPMHAVFWDDERARALACPENGYKWS